MDFLIGAATAAHQVEGNNIFSDYWVQENIKHSGFVEPSGMAVDHYNRYEEDIRIMKEAGLNAYRFSIEWARIEPEEGKFSEKEIAHYRKVLECCICNGITPIVTLHHFSSPAWLISRGGWTSEYVINAFARYAQYVAKQLGDLFNYVCTINEANMGFQINKVAADMMKAKKSKEGDVQVGVNFDIKSLFLGMFEQAIKFKCSPFKINTFLNPRKQEQEKIVMRAHQAARAAIKKVRSECKVGLTLSLFDYQPDQTGVDVAKQLWHDDFGFYLPYIKDDDFLGVQNYSRKIVTADGALEPGPGKAVTQMGYEDYPESIGHVVRMVARDYKGELLVTENGIATDDDSRRCEFIKTAVQSVLDCRKDGINVTGYMHWSLLDNFEWQAGFSKTFGLIAVDRSTQTRYPKESIKVLGKINVL
ncbi:MAG: family 1 glycosylhydrolase [Lachnospiraceae bacterium]|nr:family 1 glycosylhydrolase [Lachnospiraceae bacterium]